MQKSSRLLIIVGIMTLLVLMSLVSLFFALYSRLGREGAAFGGLIVYIGIVACLLREFHIGRSRKTDDDVDDDVPPICP
jgi:hypothetical protein